MQDSWMSRMWLPKWRVDIRKLNGGDMILLRSKRRLIKLEVTNPEAGYVVVLSHDIVGPTLWDRTPYRLTGRRPQPQKGTFIETLGPIWWYGLSMTWSLPRERYAVYTRKRPSH
ncbi:hypothetical protein EPO04_02770 [Patescibacteria group bacterium]|nr:MAG: hypothetical protein EPO04_02770 [Patescibacteria group bacterium]